MRYEATNLENQTIFETNNLRTAIVFINRYARENPNEFRVLLSDHAINQIIGVILKNGKIRNVHHYLHEKIMNADLYRNLVNTNLRTVERVLRSLGSSAEVEMEPEGAFLRQSSRTHRDRLRRFIELKAPRVLIEHQERLMKEAEEEEKGGQRHGPRS